MYINYVCHTIINCRRQLCDDTERGRLRAEEFLWKTRPTLPIITRTARIMTKTDFPISSRLCKIPTRQQWLLAHFQ